MDGNGRWAARRGLPRTEGHRRGAAAVRRTIEAAPGLGIKNLTLYAFSSDNWQRPADEVGALMHLLGVYLRKELRRCIENGVRIEVIGRRDRLGADLRREIDRAEAATGACSRLHVRLAIDYSARDAILGAARFCSAWGDFSRECFEAALSTPPVDLLIRTGGEQRLSDFLVWECAYAELVFTPCLWPDFGAPEFAECLRAFETRERRYGAIPAA
jgi:undecaprenyl diphosphate synthase